MYLADTFECSVPAQGPTGIRAVYCILKQWCVYYYDIHLFIIKFCVRCVLRREYVEGHVM